MENLEEKIYYYENYVSLNSEDIKVMSYIMLGSYNLMTNRLEGNVILAINAPKNSFVKGAKKISATSPHVVEINSKNMDNFFEFFKTIYPTWKEAEDTLNYINVFLKKKSEKES